jgi:competence protein ComEA
VEGQRSFITIVLLSLIAICAAVLGLRWYVLAQRGELKPLATPLAEVRSARPAAEVDDPPAAAAAGPAVPAAAGTVPQAETVAGSAKASSKTETKSHPAPPAVPTKQHPLDLNTATAAQLEQLPRIGEALAGRIVDYRQAHGRFRSVDALDQVEGIGPATLDAIRELLYVKPAQ